MTTYLALDNISVSAEDLGHGITRRWLFDKKIVMYTTDATTRASVDTWATALEYDMRNWPANQVYGVIHDFRKIMITPYSRRRAEEVCKLYPAHFTGRYALVLEPSVMGLGFKLFTMRRLSRLMPQLEGGFFFKFEEALAWMEELIRPLD